MNPSTVFCDNCGAANRPTARFCTKCGQTMPAASALPPTVQVGAAISSTPPTVKVTPVTTSPSLTGLLPANSLLKGRYLILSRLGQGGMGAVYKASDTQLGDRLVAVKEMSQKGLDPQELAEAADGFKREALMLAGLPHHSNLPSIYDHFADGGRWYLVMDFIAGQTLEDYLTTKGGKLPVQEVLDIGIQLTTVLSYLHTHQPPIIFRDLKPANLMRTDDGHLYLIDFGIARNFKAGQAKDTIAYGSAGYAAPEQYGKAQTTPQSDIYSLGATLHHLLSGLDPSQSPFRFAPLSGAGVPAGLNTLIAQMLNMDADKRPSSMAEVKQELQRIAAQPAVSQPPPTPSLLPPTVYVGGSALPPTQYVSGAALPPTQLAATPPLAQQPSFISPAPPSFETTLYTYGGHSESVQAVAWSPDGTRIASASNDKTVQVWDAATGQPLLTYRKHSDYVNAVTWSPDGRRIASGSSDFTVQVWDAFDGGHVFTYRKHSNAVITIAWSPDGTRIASGGGSLTVKRSDTTVRVWDAASGRTELNYQGHSQMMWTLAWSPDGTRIASGGYDQTVQVWDAITGITLYTYKGHSSVVWGVAWSPDGKCIASASGDKTVQVWDAATGKTLLTYRGHSYDVTAVAWSPDGKRIASGSGDGTMQVWDAAEGGNVFTYEWYSRIAAVAWSPDSRNIASGSWYKTVQVWKAVGYGARHYGAA